MQAIMGWVEGFIHPNPVDLPNHLGLGHVYAHNFKVK